MTDLCGPAEEVRSKLFAFRQSILISPSESAVVVLLEKLRALFRLSSRLSSVLDAESPEAWNLKETSPCAGLYLSACWARWPC